MERTPFDICVLTAANDAQAKGYRRQLEMRRSDRSLSQTDLSVIADPDGKRIGSGGSTFFVLSELYAEYGESLFSKRVLILHSGGDSRRLPAYSAVGKIFMPLPTTQHRTLFDVMIENYSYLPTTENGQVVIASGDVLLNFDPQFIHFSSTGLTGVAYPEKPAEGEFFGVYVVKEQDACVPAADILQKPNVDDLAKADAVDAGNRIWIDTGILNLAPDALRIWLECKDLINASRRGDINYNLYHEILYAIQGKLQIEDSDRLSRLMVHVNCLPYCGFYHIGKSTDVLQNFYTLTHASAQHHFQNFVRSNAAHFPGLKSAWIYNSFFGCRHASAEKPCVIEGCHIENDLALDGDNILTNIPGEVGAIHLQRGLCLNVLPLEDGRWVAVLYGLTDSFKDPGATFLNQSFDRFCEQHQIVDENLWDTAQKKEIWTAKLFPCAGSAAETVKCALALQNGDDIENWHLADRLSMSDILRSVDQQRLLQHHEDVRVKVQLLTLAEHLDDADFSFSTLIKMLESDAEKNLAIKQLESTFNRDGANHLQSARTRFWLAQLVKDKAKAESYYVSSFTAIRNAVALGHYVFEKSIAQKSFGIRSDQVVWAMLPARLDFAGGWTDTPPVCLERGGTVLNASVTLNGQYPIQVVGKIRPDNYVIGINSIDLGQRTTVTTFNELMDFSNPADWLSLPKAAFYAAGLFDENDHDLESTLKRMGGGIDLTLFSALPSGSGLGTSSILGAGLIAVLSRMMGISLQRDEIYARTSNLEQLMTTGGGWQDQIGGVAGGVKLISTQPGYDQTPQLSWTHLKQPGMELGDFYLLYYTGIRRLAKNLLRQVVGRYLNRDAEAIDILQQLAHLATDMKNDLDHRRIEDFGQKIRQAWELNTTLDAGQSTPEVDHILHQIDDLMYGAKLLGAGGGGFLFIAAKDKRAAEQIRKELDEHPPNERARFFGFDIDAAGMRLSVL